MRTAARTRRGLPRVIVQFNNHEIHALFDSASTDNFIHPRYLTTKQIRNLKLFFVSSEMEDPVILGDLWISEQEVIYNKPQGCLYAGKEHRITIRLIDIPAVSESN